MPFSVALTAELYRHGAEIQKSAITDNVDFSYLNCCS